jgi:hypothetical protein
MMMTRIPLGSRRHLLACLLLTAILDRGFSLLLNQNIRSVGKSRSSSSSWLGVSVSPTNINLNLAPTISEAAADNHLNHITAKNSTENIFHEPSRLTSKGKSYTWVERMHQVLEYRQVHGHTLIPKRDSSGLGIWWSKQRGYYRKHLQHQSTRLKEQQIAILEPIFAEEFRTNAKEQSLLRTAQSRSATWWDMYHQVKKAMKEQPCSFHNLSLQTRNNNVHSLSQWIATQRREYSYSSWSSHDKFDTQQLAALEALDAHWWKGKRLRAWEERFQELCQYKKDYGTTLVPKSHSNASLYNWVVRQRRKYATCSYERLDATDKAKFDQLQSIEFVFEVWNKRFEECY